MRNRRARLLVAALAGAAVGMGYPYLDVALKCRAPASEACVWGKAYFSLTLTVSIVVLGSLAAGLTYALLTWYGRRKDGGGQ
jgi:hypothetical protein